MLNFNLLYRVLQHYYMANDFWTSHAQIYKSDLSFPHCYFREYFWLAEPRNSSFLYDPSGWRIMLNCILEAINDLLLAVYLLKILYCL